MYYAIMLVLVCLSVLLVLLIFVWLLHHCPFHTGYSDIIGSLYIHANMTSWTAGMLETVTRLAYQAYYSVTNSWLTGNHRKVSGGKRWLPVPWYPRLVSGHLCGY